MRGKDLRGSSSSRARYGDVRMNYLCHARDCLDRPFELLGAILPDWLRILDRRARLRPWMVEGRAAAPGSPRAEIHSGLRRHFEDDRWFHATPAFGEVTGEIARRIRTIHPDRPERRLRASFYAHILLEMLLDSWLMEERPDISREFAGAIAALDPQTVADEAGRIAPHPVSGLESMIERFTDPRVLHGYQDDAEVVRRLDRMGGHVSQPELPPGFIEITSQARVLVRRHGAALLSRPGVSSVEGET